MARTVAWLQLITREAGECDVGTFSGKKGTNVVRMHVSSGAVHVSVVVLHSVVYLQLPGLLRRGSEGLGGAAVCKRRRHPGWPCSARRGVTMFSRETGPRACLFSRTALPPSAVSYPEARPAPRSMQCSANVSSLLPPSPS